MIKHLVFRSSFPVAAAIASVLLGGQARADEREPQNTITVSPLPLIFNRELDLEYERAVNDDVSLFAGPSFILGTTSSCSCSYRGYGATVGARLFTDQAPRGLFFGVFGTVAYASASVDGSSASGSGFGWEAGGMAGYTFIVAGHLDISLGLGAGYAQEQVKVTSGGSSTSVGASGVLPALRLAVGAAF
ncbi:MAG TPA: DUF3575 domain-containing protein [Polyangiaceae bacterium]